MGPQPVEPTERKTVILTVVTMIFSVIPENSECRLMVEREGGRPTSGSSINTDVGDFIVPEKDQYFSWPQP